MTEAAARLSPDARREQVLTCATRLFAERGFAGVSMTDVAHEAGVARGLVNHYFGSKRDLELAVVAHMLRVPTVLPEGDDWADAVDRWLDLVERHREAFFGAVDVAHPELRAVVDDAREQAGERALLVLGADVGPELRAVARAYSAFAEQAVREWLRTGRLTRDEVRHLVLESLPQLIAIVTTRSDTA